MSVDLAMAASAWLADQRARGYLLKDHRWLLAGFLKDLDARGINKITVADALAYARRVPETSRRWQATRLRAVAGLAAYVHDIDPEAAELIPAGLIAARTPRRIPYLYTPEQIDRLMGAASEVLVPEPFALAIRTLIGLLAVTGVRSGEAIALDVEDFHVDEALLVVTGKYARQRLVPLHPSTVEVLMSFQARRPRSIGVRGLPLLFGPRGGRLNADRARAAFARLVTECALVARPGCGAPRLHDFRHTFAVNSLIDAHRHDADVDARLATLAAFLGHVEPAKGSQTVFT